MTYLSNATFVQTTANLATALFAFFIGVQLLVATGILPISILWGGRKSELTPALRVASVEQPSFWAPLFTSSAPALD